jgi:RNA polymerase subunit RPABC4/transcription elongation factor Spt4
MDFLEDIFKNFGHKRHHRDHHRGHHHDDHHEYNQRGDEHSCQPNRTLVSCPKCSENIPSSYTFCPNCGSPSMLKSSLCSSCKREIPLQAKFCPSCGGKVG